MPSNLRGGFYLVGCVRFVIWRFKNLTGDPGHCLGNNAENERGSVDHDKYDPKLPKHMTLHSLERSCLFMVIAWLMPVLGCYAALSRSGADLTGPQGAA
jgi:hypothetical protein